MHGKAVKNQTFKCCALGILYIDFIGFEGCMDKKQMQVFGDFWRMIYLCLGASKMHICALASRNNPASQNEHNL